MFNSELADSFLNSVSNFIFISSLTQKKKKKKAHAPICKVRIIKGYNTCVSIHHIRDILILIHVQSWQANRNMVVNGSAELKGTFSHK
ncbi:hypothetical protein GDO86_015660 [Hymenochirus boettgeri]|uniref:Uncharacterized protein n=1 Tax=Hymenochirus boettgeri TaxID=247094 RepID=A0A8T2JYT5_9PIPI|nr:hypothetical protein GDO86_015660 [Hymenochirus boettgeri]